MVCDSFLYFLYEYVYFILKEERNGCESREKVFVLNWTTLKNTNKNTISVHTFRTAPATEAPLLVLKIISK